MISDFKLWSSGQKCLIYLQVLMFKKLLDIKYFSSFPLTHYIEGHAGVFVQLFVNSKFHIQLLQQGCCSLLLHAGLGKWANLGNDNKVTAAVAELMWLWQGADLLIGDVNVCWLLCPGFMHPNYHHRHHTRTLEEELFHAWLCLIDRKLGLFIQCSKICMNFRTLIKVILWLKRSSLEVIIYPASWALFENK